MSSKKKKSKDKKSKDKKKQNWGLSAKQLKKARTKALRQVKSDEAAIRHAITEAPSATGYTIGFPADAFAGVEQIDPRSTPGFTGDKEAGQTALASRAGELNDLQEKLWASEHGSRSGKRVLLVVQGMDTSGKGGIMRHVVGSVDPQGVQIKAFKAPTSVEKRHHFLWRIKPHVPDPGMIGVFDRSHYEDVLIHRVHGWADEATIEKRYAQINEWEKELVDSGVRIVKVMLHISAEEQWERLYTRLQRPDKHWKFNPGDLDEREQWPAYMDAYTAAIRATSTAHAPWHVIPADRKWYSRLAVQNLLIDALKGIDPGWPEADFDVAAAIERMDRERNASDAAAKQPSNATTTTTKGSDDA